MRFNTRNTVEQSFDVDIRALKRAGMLTGYNGGFWGRKNKDGSTTGVQIGVCTEDEFLGKNYIRFWYGIKDGKTEETRNFDYKVPLSTTRCHFGGVRYWFRCYANLRYACGRRVTTLFITSQNPIFACRHCHNLSYNSKNKNRRNAFYSLIEKGRLERERNKIIFKKRYRPYYAGEHTRIGKRILKMNEKIEKYSRTPITLPNWLNKPL